MISTNSSAEASHSSDDIIIQGRILPTSELYSQHSFRIRFSFSSAYPFNPPTLRFLDKMYHPNIDDRGHICLDILNPYDGYKPYLSLADFIIAADQLISIPNIDKIINIEAGTQYKNDRNEFNRKALEFTQLYGQPRT